MSRVDRGLVQWVRGRWVGDWGLGGGLRRACRVGALFKHAALMCAQAQLRGEVRLYISLRSARTAARWVHGPRWREREWRASDTVVNLSGHSAVRECGAPGVWHWQCGEWGPHYGLGASELKVVRCPTFSPSYYVPHRRVSGASGSGLRHKCQI